MPKYQLAGKCDDNEFYVDYDINTDNPHEYWVLSYDKELRHWYALQRVGEDLYSPFDDGRAATRVEVAQMLETIPINQLPANALWGHRL